VPVIAIAAGAVIGLVDSSPGWDSTGITAGLLLLASGGIAALDGRRPWLWAILVGAPTPVLEIPGGSTGSLLALGFAAVGATIGWGIARAASASAQGSPGE
jgi:hypothetical protein